MWPSQKSDQLPVSRILSIWLASGGSQLQASVPQTRMPRSVKRVRKAQRETEHVRGKMAAAETAARKAQLKMEKERDELQKAFVQLQHRDAQYKADLKKKELLTVKLQDQLSRTISDSMRRTFIRHR